MNAMIYKKKENVKLDTEFENAEKYGKVRLGKEIIFWKKGLRWNYLPMDTIQYAYRRVEGVNARMCCGTSDLAIQKLMLILKSKETIEILIGDALLRGEAEELFESMKKLPFAIEYKKPTEKH